MPGVAAGCTVDVQSQRALERAIAATAAQAGYSLRNVVRYTAANIAYAGQRFTDLSRTHEDETAPVPATVQSRRGRKGKSGKYVWAWIPQNHTGKMKRLPVKLATARKHGKVWRAKAWRPTKWAGVKRKVESRGAHKAGWSGILSGLGRRRARGFPGKAPWSRTTSATTYAKVDVFNTKAASGVTEKLDFPGIYHVDTRKRMAQRAVAHVTATLVNRLLAKFGVDLIKAGELKTAQPVRRPAWSSALRAVGD